MSKSFAKIKKEVPKGKLSVNQFMSLRSLFLSKSWNIEEDSSISYFNKYYKTLLTLNDNQRDFLISLSHNFLVVDQEHYLEWLIDPLHIIRTAFPNDNLIFIACMTKEDKGKLKGSLSVLYQLKGSKIKTKIDLKTHYIIDNLAKENFKELENQKNFKIILVDDFIGTGETAGSAVDYIRELAPSLKDNSSIKVLSIVAMQNGIDYLKSKGVDCYQKVICKRGINDHFQGEELVNAIRTMQEIESTIKKLKDEYKFGYHRSEALVCMERCPNNTFPIYWLTPNMAPYER